VAPGVTLAPLLAGGTGSNSTSEDQPEAFPEGYEAGTHNLPGIAGLLAGMAFVLEQGVTAIGDHERSLALRAAERLVRLPGVTLYGPSDPTLRTGVLSLTVAGRDPAEVAFELDRRFAIAVRSGLHCAPRAHRTLGSFPGGTVRMSPGWFTTEAEVDVFCDAVGQCL
jgi:selenocysteine lyase/cysteine desulfurase